MRTLEKMADELGMFDDRRFDEIRASERAPLLEALRFPEHHHMVIDAIPAYAQAVSGGVLDHTFQFHAMASHGQPQYRRCFGNGCLEGGGIRRIDGEMGNFRDHEPGFL